MDEPSRNESNTIILRIKFKSASLEEFTQRYGADVSPGGIFIKTKQPLDVGASLQFEFSLADGTPLLVGNGTVAWIRENDPLRSNNSPGMGLRFDKLNPDSHQNHQKILAGKAKAPSRTVPSAIGAQPPSAVAPSSKPAMAAPMATSPLLNAPMVDLDKLLDDPTIPGSDSFLEGAKTEITDRSFTESILAAELAKRKTSEPPSPDVPAAMAPPSEAAGSGVPRVVEPFEDSKPISSPISLAPPEPDAVVAVDVGTGSIEIPIGMIPSAPVATTEAVDLAPAGAETNAPVEELQELSAPLPMEDVPEEDAPEEDAPEEVAPERTIENPIDGSLLPKEAPGMRGFSMPPTPVPATSSVPASTMPVPVAAKPSTMSGKWLWIAAVAAAVIAFVLVYLLKSKPWETPAPVAQITTPAASPATPVAAQPTLEPPPTAATQAAEPVKAGEPEKANEPAVAAEPVNTAESAKENEPAKAAEPVKPEIVALKPENTAETPTPEGKVTPPSKSIRPTISPIKPEEKPAAVKQTETYRWAIRSVPANAEVLIDGEYFCRTPCDRRVLDPTKPAVIVLRKVGFEPFERPIGTSETWVKKGKDNYLTVMGKLTKIKAPPTPAPVPAPGQGPTTTPAPSEPKSGLMPPPLVPKPEAVTPSAEGAPKPDSTLKSKAKPAPEF